MNAHELTNNAYILQVHFKYTHNILATKEKLFTWKISDSPHCICGVVDTNIHHLIQCKLVQPFWEKIFKYIKDILGISFPISETEAFFGIINDSNDPIIDSINYIFLLAKTFIWKEKRLGKPCTLHEFSIYLHEQLLIEMSSKLFKQKPFYVQLFEQI